MAANLGLLFSVVTMTVSGHCGGHVAATISGDPYADYAYIPYMYVRLIGYYRTCYLARDNAGIAGEYSFMGLTAAGVTTLALDARDNENRLWKPDGRVRPDIHRQRFLRPHRRGDLHFRRGGRRGPIAQTFSFQNMLTGTSNIAGANTIFDASMGTGTGASGAFEFFTAPAGSSGTIAERAFPGVDDRRRAGGDDRSRRQLDPALVFRKTAAQISGLGSANSGIGSPCLLWRRAGILIPGQ